MFAQSSLQKIRGIVTEKQYRRIQMYCEGMTYREIAEAERVMFPSPYLDKFIAIHQTHSHVPRERSPPGDTP